MAKKAAKRVAQKAAKQAATKTGKKAGKTVAKKPTRKPTPKPTPTPARKTARKPAKSGTVLRGISDIRRFFYRNQTPYYFVSATNFNVMGIDEWVHNFRYINYIDCFDGAHPNLLCPPELPHEQFTSIEDINDYLLGHPDVVSYIQRRAVGDAKGRAVFLMFDERTERRCRDLGLEICFPPSALRNQVDDKISATRIADRAGIASVPNVLAPVKTFGDLQRVAKKLGPDLVVQTAFGDSGHTTFFISGEADWKKHGAEIAEAPEVKIMKRIRCRGAALEACVTRHGTIVGPLMTERVGFPELTPYRGGWCGNEVVPEAFSQQVRDQAARTATAFGNELWKMGYRGYFELDFLRDLDTDRVYLGEVNPRVTGASAMTNLASFAHADAPLFLFHLLEYAGVDYELDTAELNRRWADPQNIDRWGQLVIKHTSDSVELITEAPRTGVWRMEADGQIVFDHPQTHRRTVDDESEAFFLRISRPGDYFYEGADIGILISPGRMMTDDFQLNERAQAWIRGIRAHYKSRPLGAASAVDALPVQVGDFKIM
ncbi:MAG: biotin carboxylase [Candidatus Eisenbacteria bacterium]|uniref:Biotin carboxylase n=1 Tax=Eiseniibacteriota bacterium TaxID=2212470 RepID=A0A956RPJ2_UNCEI|nr:biotin carboxylase [Candidatus Eisenbacteria bacterium]